MSSIADSAAGTIADLFGDAPALSEPEPEPTPEPEPDDEPLELAPVATDELDLGWEDDDEPVALEGMDEWDEEDLRQKVVKLTKQVDHEKRLRVQTGVKEWRREAAAKFPYSQPEQITADSRREFLRQAQANDTQFRSQAQPLLDQFKAREDKLRATVEAEVRAEFEKSWGRPTVGSGPSAPIGADTDERLAKARKKLDMFGAAKALMDGGKI